MNEEYPPSPLSDDELLLDTVLQETEPKDFVGTDDFLAAEESLHTALGEILTGSSESSEEGYAHVALLIEVASKNFAHVVSSIDDIDEMYKYCATLLNRSLKGIDTVVKDHTGDGIIVEVDNVNISGQRLKAIMEEEDGEEDTEQDSRYEVMQELFESSVASLIEDVYERAPENINEAREIRRTERKETVINAAKDLSKIALSALATGLAVRYFGRK
ncbi:MAG: hypothetical protein WAQ22_02480 [Candidatus Saccharimonas sp.]